MFQATACRTSRVVKMLSLAAFILLIAPTSSHAENQMQVWRDSDGVVVRNSWGNCVRSVWDNGVDVCASGAATEVQHQTIIAQEDRTVYFDFNKATLTEEAKAKLNSLANILKSASDVLGASVVGYADRIGSKSYNDALSKKRATMVRDYLVAHDIVNTFVAKTHWVGKSEPTAMCKPKMPREKLIECLQPDRKVQVDIIYSAVQK
jgi:OOP family OmpA-OmpF porin